MDLFLGTVFQVRTIVGNLEGWEQHDLNLERCHTTSAPTHKNL